MQIRRKEAAEGRKVTMCLLEELGVDMLSTCDSGLHRSEQSLSGYKQAHAPARGRLTHSGSEKMKAKCYRIINTLHYGVLCSNL